MLRQYLYINYWVLEFRYNQATVITSIIVAALTLVVIFRIVFFRTIKSDRVSYRWYMTLYNLLLVSACVSFGSY